MTPTATTPAARRGRGSGTGATGRGSGTGGTGRGTGSAVPGHRKAIRPNAAPRRVSGPLRGRLAGGAAIPNPATTRRRSARATAPPLGQRLAARVRALPNHQLLDRIVRGRAWILILGVMLAGIVAMQVEVLKLGASMGRSIERTSALQSRNELLRESVAALADQQRIERLASGMGMVMPSPGAVGFLRARRVNIGKAAFAIKSPDAVAFASLLTSNGAITTTPSTVSSSTTSGVGTTMGMGSTTGAGMTTTVGTATTATSTTTGQPTTQSTTSGASVTPTGVATTPTTSSTPTTQQSAAGTATTASTGGAGLTGG
jgi:hypothetical protein